jgi:hypothetical protein
MSAEIQTEYPAIWVTMATATPKKILDFEHLPSC